MGCFRSADVRQLLHNKFVVVLGDSIQRSVYKDLVKFLQRDEFLSKEDLKNRGEPTFENDSLIEGGQMEQMHNGTTFREVRQYRSGHHLVRFYFLTRVYSTYLESILSDFQSGPQPDVLIANSCVWDVNRYNDHHLESYKTNLDHLFLRLKEVLSPQCLIIWSMTMPVGYGEKETPMFHIIPQNLRMDMVVGNFFSATLAHFHNLDVLDMHYHFRFDLRFRWYDSVHWNYFAHRKYTQILLTHIAQAWGVESPKNQMLEDSVVHLMAPHLAAPRPELPSPRQEPQHYSPGAAYMSGYTSFAGSEICAMSGIPSPGNVTNGKLINSENSVVHLMAPHLAAPLPELPSPRQEPQQYRQNSVVHLMAPHLAAPRPELPSPRQEPQRYSQNSVVHLMAPHLAAPRPELPSPRQEPQHYRQNSVVNLTAPHLAAPRPKLPPPRQEPQRYSQGAAYMPGYTSFDGSEICAMSGNPSPENVTNGKLINSETVSPFVTDSPLLNVNITPGYFRPPAGGWKMRPRRKLKPRGGWRHPYC